MKKTISLILCLAMIMSTIAFAMPAFAFDLDYSVDTSKDYAHTEIASAVLAGTSAITAPEFADGREGTKINLSVTYDADWAIDDEAIATIEGDGKTAVVTTKGYAGELCVTTTSKEDPAVSDVAYIRLRGASKARPGLNLLTGTSSPYTFEADATENGLSIYLPRNARYSANAYKNGNNGSDSVVEMYHEGGSGQRFPQLTITGFNTNMVELDRPIVLSFDWVGQFGNVWLLSGSKNTYLSNYVGASAGGSWNTTDWNHFTYVWSDKNTKNQFVLQIGKDPGERSLYLDNLSLVPYYKVIYADSKGNELSCDYVAPTETTFTIPAERVASLNTDKYAGYMIKGTTELVTEVTLVPGADVVLVPAVKDGVEFVQPTAITGVDGLVENVDYRDPAIYYTFEEALDVDTISLDEIKSMGGTAYKYDAETNTLIVFPKSTVYMDGKNSFGALDSNIMTVTGKFVTIPASPEISYGSAVVRDGSNLLKYGDFEDGYSPFYQESPIFTTRVVADDTDSYFEALPPASGSGYPHIISPVVVNSGSTYKLYARVKSTRNERNVAQLNIRFNGTSTGGIGAHSSIASYHVFHHGLDEYDPLRNIQTLSAEFVPTLASGGAGRIDAAVYTNPRDGLITGVNIYTYELYKRTDVKFVPNVAVDASVAEPVTQGIYLYDIGNVKSDVTTIEVPEYIWPASDDKRVVTGWISKTDRIIYQPGDVIDLTAVELDEVGDYTLEPYVEAAEGYEFVNITFDGEGSSFVPSDINGVYMTGDVLVMDDFYPESIKSTVANKRFLGWSVDGEKSGLVQPGETITLTGDVHFTAIVGYDFNFAIAESRAGWGYNYGKVSAERNGLAAKFTPGGQADFIFSRNNANIPAGLIHKMIVWVEADYEIYASATGEPNNATFALNNTWEGMYFGFNGQGAAAGRRMGLSAKHEKTGPDGTKYIGFEGDTTAVSSWDSSNTLQYIRIDPNNIMANLIFRYIEFAGFDYYEETAVAVTGIDAPVVGTTPDTKADGDALAKVDSITWSPELTARGLFDENTVYTATVKLSPKDNLKVFNPETTVTIDGKAADTVEIVGRQVVATVTYPATEAYKEFEISIDGPTVINKAGRTTQYKIVVDGDIPVKTAQWSMPAEYEGYAVLNKDNGRVTPIRNIDELVIEAISDYNPKKTARFTIKIENQAAETAVIYNKNTTDTVTNMPDPTFGAGIIKLTNESPERAGYSLRGWSLSPDSREVVGSVTAEGDEITVYAVWDKALVAFEMNGNLTDSVGGGTIRITQVSNSATKFEDGCYYIKTPASGSADLRLQATFPAINVADVDKFVVRMSHEASSSYELYVHQIAGANIIDGHTSFAAKGLDSFVVYEKDLGNNSVFKKQGTFSTFWFDPQNILDSAVKIDYIRIITTKRNVTFDANAASGTVTGMPETKSVNAGETVTISEVPARDGYKFLGWSTTADALTGSDKVYVGDDLTLYAIWAEEILITDPNSVEAPVDTGKNNFVVKTAPGALVKLFGLDADGTPSAEPIEELMADEAGLLSVNVDEALEGVLFTSEEEIEFILCGDAEDMAEIAESMQPAEEEEKGSTTILINGKDSSGSDGSAPKKFDSKIVDVVNNNDAVALSEGVPTVNNIKEEKTAEGGDDAGEPVVISELMASEGDILLNFNHKSELSFFPESALRRFTFKGISGSIASYTNLGKAPGNNDAPALFTTTLNLNADTHRYIVMKIRNSSDSKCRIYYSTDELGFSESRAKTVDHGKEFTMAVYDMSTTPDWKGKIKSLFFSMGVTEGDVVEIDWILFTDNVPESMDVIEGAKETFPVVNAGQMPFEDVKDEWFAAEVASAYRLGFVNGTSTSPALYTPNGQVTIAETITLAVRLNCIFNGLDIPEVKEGAEWYSAYVEMAIKEGIIKSAQFADYTAPALRRDVAMIMNKALPTTYVKAINMFTAIPDVPTKDPAYASIRKLYNAGVLTGMDEAYSFYPDNNVTRAEIAAIVNRLAIPDNRKRIVTEAELESRRKYYYAEDLDTATLGNCHTSKLTIKDGFATASGKTKDPIVYLVNAFGQLNGKEITKITVAFKWDESKAKANPVFFFTTPTGGWAAGRMISGKDTGMKTEKGSSIFTFDLKSNAQFNDTITAIRFDPYDVMDAEFSIEYFCIE